MTWITFSTYLIVGYVFYYTLNVLFDLLKKTSATPGQIETLTVSEETETIEIDDSFDDEIITVNESRNRREQSKTAEISESKEVEEESHEQQEQIIPSTVEIEISENGGLSLKSLVEMHRLRAIRESNELPFAS